MTETLADSQRRSTTPHRRRNIECPDSARAPASVRRSTRAHATAGEPASRTIQGFPPAINGKWMDYRELATDESEMASFTLTRQRAGSQSCGLDALRRGTRRVSARLDRSWSAPRACQHSAGAYTWPHSRSQHFGRALTAENAQSTSLGSTEIRQTSNHTLLDSIAATTPNSQRRHGPAACLQRKRS